MARQLIVTPPGQAWWAKVFEPEEDKFDDGKPPAWSISWCKGANDKDTLQVMQQIEAEFARLHGEGAKPSKNAWPFKDQMVKQGDQLVENGQVEFRFKKNSVTRKGMELQRPTVYDSRKNPWPDDLLIGNKSLVKVAFTTWGWEDKFGKKGVSLSLEAVQVLDLVPYERLDPANAFGEENGYVLDTPANAFTEEKKEEALTPSQRIQRRAAELSDELSEDEVPF